MTSSDTSCPTLRQLACMVEHTEIDERAIVEAVVTMILKKFRVKRIHVQTGRELLILDRLGMKVGDIFHGRGTVGWLNKNYPLYGFVNRDMYHNVFPSVSRLAQDGYFVRRKEGYVRTGKEWNPNPLLQKRLDWIDDEHRAFRENFPSLTIG